MSTQSAGREIVITRVFDAPRALVWRAWTDPTEMMRWWGPEHFTTPVIEIDLRVGGRFRYCMRAPDGKDYWGVGVYREVAAPERLVYTDSFADENGNVVPATHYGMAADYPMETLVTVMFAEHDGKTTMTLRHAGQPVSTDEDTAEAGWSSMLDKLGALFKK
jgi:uncharacterized protein YndB with AHSA1/START domain